MKVVFLTSDWVEAQLIAGLLESSGIKPFLLGAEVTRMKVFPTAPIGDVIKVAVPPHQLEDALAVLKEYRKRQGLDPNYGTS
jgi:hypothetical protein